MSTEKITVKYK